MAPNVAIRAFQKKIKVLESQFSMVFLVGHAKRGLHPKFELILVKPPLSAIDLKFVWELLWKRRIFISIEPANFEKQCSDVTPAQA